MKILLVILALLVGLIFTLPVSAAGVHIYFNQENAVTDNMRIVLFGLPDSPIECTFVKVVNPADPADENYYKIDYDVMTIPDGAYTLTGKMVCLENVVEGADGVTHIYSGESEESAPFPFGKQAPGIPSNMGLDALQE